MKVPGWQCDLGDGEFDHDWEYCSDWYGDPEVINGTADFYFKRCRQCGAEESCAGEEYNDWMADDGLY